MDLTIAICTHNGETRIPRVLDRLCDCRQYTPESITWELLIIDNCSTDATSYICQSYGDRLPLKIIQEGQKGLAFARQRAVEAAQGELVGFLDDDNLPDTDWIRQAVEFGEQHPDAGAYGSRIFPDYSVEPPPNFHRIAPFLAITDRGPDARPYPREKRLLPPGAGLVVRRQAWLTSVPPKLTLVGRTTSMALASEDLEALVHLQQHRWEIWYAPQLRVHHLIPSWRLEPDYLYTLMRGIGLSRYRTRMLSFSPILRPLALIAYSLNDSRRILRHLLCYRGQLREDIVAQAELRFYIACLTSPFFFWKQQQPPDKSPDSQKT
ncbi:hormogonium polysaccharide biosynthesis glycosyltransferase HpsE [Phormidium yuhuli AB48]|uniref:Hormogonium polysaccharide biosynthesis glycosyltransferase HpsE n=1 Tax=Phormidium yuhuli AB48 TaxID=2940671 RepID=A0ABY5ATG0_9CYAN|nr:hormogonium polysaccharide biosynthesis glycosyltransferase HpsE [Phormidium yuhuli]USR91428.1 hormogonium polysaccharide biosynthesis glycosyltransferase HpsE [Phormidium yuhuli AB48]